MFDFLLDAQKIGANKLLIMDWEQKDQIMIF